ncbi:BTB/POZ-like [Macleaya cordata]|uniref:BTB/POZ-like n=1 Tax=Macleaya cordata TaxID=56857 RepID=A0A200QQB8_MACCD|nr:BTB/POZ-like [Macleaya cordata]
MDCCVCTSMILRPPRNTICMACYEGAKNMIAFFNNLQNDTASDKLCATSTSAVSQLNSSKGKIIEGVLKWMKEMKQREDGLNEKLNFLGGLVVAFRDNIHSDIQIKPGNGPSIPAHRALLAVRSVIFKNMLESDGCKAAPNDTIALPELNHEELESLLEFLYSGNLGTEKVEKHVYALSVAADKYEIPYLQTFCERRMLESLDSSNALEVLEISDVCSNKTLREAAMKSVVKHMEDIVFSTRYDEFARKNPHLSVQITRALFMENNSNKKIGV